MILDLGCNVEAKALKVRNTHNSFLNTHSAQRLVVRMTKWNEDVMNEIFNQDIETAVDLVKV